MVLCGVVTWTSNPGLLFPVTVLTCNVGVTDSYIPASLSHSCDGGVQILSVSEVERFF